MSYSLLFLASFLIGIGLVSKDESSQAASNWRIATNGSDSNPCTPTQPCLTMNRAYQVASAGDTVEIAGGTYGTQTITGTKASWVYFRPVTGATVNTGPLFIHADFVEVRDIDVSEFKIEANDINDVTLRNVDVNGYLGYSGNNIKRISMYGGSVGPMVNWHPQIAPSNALNYSSAWATDLLFDGVYWHDMTRNTVEAHTECLQVAGTTRFTMRNSKFERCAIFDLSFTQYNGSGPPVDVLLENNFFATTTGNGSINDGYYALNYGGMRGLTIRNNSFAQGINENNDNQNVRLIGNILSTAWNCLNATYQYNVYQWTSNLNCSPTDKWVNGPQYSTSNLGYVGPVTSANGLYLASTSPAKDFISAATASTLGMPNSDIDGHARPVNTNYDVGADEYGSTGGVVPAPPPAVPAAPVVSLSASPSSLQSGNASTLSWSATNSPTSCTASGDWSGSKTASGSQSTGTLSTVKTYTYTLTCSNAGGSGSKSIAVVVSAVPPTIPNKPVVSMTINPSTINQGSSSTLSWSATNSPSSCTASGDWSGSKTASGSQSTGTLSTVKTYTYNLTCMNAGGSTTGSVALVVIPSKPVVTLSASPTTLKVGSASTLTWSATNSPSSCTASGDWSGSKAASGSQSTGALNTAKTYTYTLTCSNSGGSGSASVAVTANNSGVVKGPKPKVKITVSPQVVEQGQQATLSWVAEDGSNISCKAGDGWTGTKAATGTQNVTPDKDGQTYSITCENENGGESASTTVSVATVKQDGSVTVNDKVVPNLKVSNPSIVGESIAGQPIPKTTMLAEEASPTEKLRLFETTKGKLIIAGAFAGLVTTAIGSLFITRRFLRRNQGPGTGGPTDFISGL